MEKKILKKKTLAPKLKKEPQAKPKAKLTRPLKAKKTASLAIAPTGFGLYNLKAPKGACKRKKILGRGPSSGHGKTSTRGSKGQTSRAGRHFYPGFEGGQTPLIRRVAKRGFTSAFKKEYQILNLVDLKNIKDTNITLSLLEEKGLIKDKTKLVKILGNGELKNAATIQAHAFSKQAADKIQKAGGKIETINVS